MSGVRIRAWLAALVLAGSVAADGARLVAVGDVHGTIDGFRDVLAAAGIIDADGGWSGGDTVFVQTGDLTDRGPAVRAVLDLMMRLEAEAPGQGGRVVALLGNHEVSNLAGYFDELSTPAETYARIWADFTDLRSDSRRNAAYRQWNRWRRRYPGCGTTKRSEWMAAHPPGFLEYMDALAPEGKYGRWLRRLPVAAEVDGTVFAHGGFSPALLERGLGSVAAINRLAAATLEQFDQDRQWLIDDGVAPAYATLTELYCGLNQELAALAARIERDGERTPAELVGRQARLAEIRGRLPGTPDWFLSQEDGPTWFRGFARWQRADEPQLEALLEAFGAERFVVGHTPMRGRIQPRFEGRIFLIDTAMAYGDEVGGRGSALLLENGRAVAVYADRREELAGIDDDPPADDLEPEAVPGGGSVLQGAPEGEAAAPAAPPGAAEETADAAAAARMLRWLDADGQPLRFRSEGELLDFLRRAHITERREVGVGVTHPDKLTLERDGVRLHAVFHEIDVDKQRQRLAGGKTVMFFRDSYRNNVAAFELSRLLGLDNVPPAVVRRIGRTHGSVQLWIQNARTEEDRRREDVTPPGEWRRRWHDMWVFDNLINNIDRNQGNILYDGWWDVWLIDHTRSFSRGRELPSPDRVKRCSRRLLAALRGLDEGEVRQRLTPYLKSYEINALLARRGKLVELIEARVAEHGEKHVLFNYGEADEAIEIRFEELDVPEAP